MVKSREQLKKSFFGINEWNQLLLDCAYKGDKTGVVEALDHGANINATNLHGETALHIAAIDGDIVLASILIGRNADLTIRDKIGLNPIEWATKNEHQRMMEMFNRREQRLKQPLQAESNVPSQTQPAQAAQPKQSSQIPGALYNMGKFAYDSGLATAIGKTALNVGQFMYDSGLGTMIGKVIINNRINAFKTKIWAANKSYGIGSYLSNNSSKAASEAGQANDKSSDQNEPIKFMNKGAKLQPNERGLSIDDDGSIFYHVGDKTIPVKVSDDLDQGVSQAVYNKILAQLQKLKKLNEIKVSIFQKIATMREANKVSPAPLSQEGLEKEIIREVESSAGIKLTAEDLHDSKKLDKKIVEEVKGFYILEKCNEMKLRILQRMADFDKENNHLNPEAFAAKIIEEIYTKEGIKLTAEDLHDPKKLDEKIADETIKSEMEGDLSPEEQAHLFSFAEEKENFVDAQDFPPGLAEDGENFVDAQDFPSELESVKAANYQLLQAALTSDIGGIDRALANGAKINFQFEKDGSTALHLAAKSLYPLETLQALLGRGADLKIQDNKGNLPIHKVCEGMKVNNRTVIDVASVYTLLENNLETVNVQNKEGQTAMHLAARNGDVTLLKIMFELAEDNAKAVNNNPNVKKVEVGINIQDIHGDSPLYHAIVYGCPENIQLLCANHADVNLINKSGQTALHYALEFGSKEIKNIAILSELVPTDQKVVNAKDKDGNTLLHKAAVYAATSGDSSLYNKLKENGGDQLIKNKDGISAQQILMNYAINADKRKSETLRIEDGKTKRQLDDLLPVCVALGTEVEMKKAQAYKHALASGGWDEKEALKIFKASTSSRAPSSAIIVKSGNEGQRGLRG